jgi:hypothetical protein
MSKELESIVKNIPPQENLGLMTSLVKSTKHLKVDNTIISNSSKKWKRRKELQTHVLFFDLRVLCLLAGALPLEPHLQPFLL